jgi:hypothetical protein
MEHQMTVAHHFETTRANALREATQIEDLINRLKQRAEQLESEAAAEEKRVGVSDSSNAAYPILARVLRVRRQNLKATVAALEKRLALLRQIFPEAASVARISEARSG